MKPIDPRLLRYSRSSRGFILFAVILSIAQAIASITQAYLLTRIIIGLFQEKLVIQEFTPQVRTLLSVFIYRAIIAYISHLSAGYFSARIKSELRESLVDRMLYGENKVVQKYGSANLSLLLTRGINHLDGYLTKFIPQLFVAACVPLIVGLAIFREDWKSGLVVLLTIPLIPLFGVLIGKFTAAATSRKLNTLHFLSSYFLDLLTGLTTLKIYKRSKHQIKKLGEIGDQYRKETMRVLRISFLSSLALELVATLSVALLAVSIGIRLVDGNISLRTGLLVLILAPEVYWPIRQVAALFHAAEDGLQASTSIFSILDAPIINGEVKISGFLAISWSDLVVKFDGRKEIFIPAAQLMPGKIYGVVGPSGSGKSTLISTLLGFANVTSGTIVISTSDGDFDFEKIDKVSWRKLISWMPQDPHFRFGKVGDYIGNLTLDSVSINEKDLPQGLNTEVGSLVDAMSYGQRRRIALLRALAKKADLVLLDEPTASIDDVTEDDVSRLIKQSMSSNQIVLISSHRSFTQKLMDETIKVGGR
mgnify:CR=1 FL=1